MPKKKLKRAAPSWGLAKHRQFSWVRQKIVAASKASEKGKVAQHKCSSDIKRERYMKKGVVALGCSLHTFRQVYEREANRKIAV